jgi:hypothetical protein
VWKAALLRRGARGIAQGALILVTATSAAWGQADVTEPVVLQFPASIRSTGFNGAGVALVGNAGALFFNPAGLATIRHMAVEGALQSGPFAGELSTAAIGWRLRQFDLGFGVHFFDYDTSPGPGDGFVTAAGTPVDATELLAVGSLVYRFGLIALGGSGKWVRRDIAGVRETGVSADLGLAIAFFDIMAIGFAVQNVGGNWSNASNLVLPRLTRFGFTMNYVDPQGSFRLLSTLEWQWPDGRDGRFVIGGEGGIVLRGVGVVGRLGYGGGKQGATRAAVTFGASLELGAIDVDFAYDPNDLLAEPARRIGVRLAF